MADTFPTALSLVVVERLQEAKKKKVSSLFWHHKLGYWKQKSCCPQIIFVEVKMGSEFESIMVLCDAVLRRKE